MLSRQTVLRLDVDRRYHLGIEGELIKRGRNKGLMGWFKGRPWAQRHITLECTYTNSVLRTWKGDEKRDTIDILGSTARECDPSAVNGKGFCIEILFSWGEVFILQVISSNGDAEAKEERRKWIDALNVAGRTPTAVDAIVEKMKIHVLSFEHESCVYDYIAFKTNNKDDLDEIITATGGLSVDGQRDTLMTSGKRLHSSRPEKELLSAADKWINYLEEAFPCLYRTSSEQAEMEDYYKDELIRTIATHEREKSDTLAAHGDEGLISSRFTIKVLTDKVNYAAAKEKRLFEEVDKLVDQFSRRSSRR